MSDYTHRLTICTPVAMITEANNIARSMDPDVGGANSFEGVRATNHQGAEFVVCDVWVRGHFAQQATAMLGNPAILHAACGADYAARWPELVSPTLAECTAFIESSIILITERSNIPLKDVIPLTLVIPPQEDFI